MAKATGVPLFIVGVDGTNNRVVLDCLWDPKGDINAENAKIKSYIETHYSGVRPDRA